MDEPVGLRSVKAHPPVEPGVLPVRRVRYQLPRADQEKVPGPNVKGPLRDRQAPLSLGHQVEKVVVPGGRPPGVARLAVLVAGIVNAERKIFLTLDFIGVFEKILFHAFPS